MTATVDAIEVRNQIVTLVRDFVRREVEPIAQEYDNEDIYPQQLIEPMREMGLFGITIPEEYGGLGLDHTTFATIFEELSRGWMSVSGIIGTHHVLAHIVANFGTQEQKGEFLPRLASGALRGGLALTEPDAGSDVQSGKTTARKDGEEYVINGTKMFITNAEYGNVFAVLTKTDPDAQPRHRGMSCFVVEKPNPGIHVGQHLDKLGYRGLDSSELIFDDCRVGSETLVGGVEGQGFKQVMAGLETGRINVAARAVGVATAAFDAAIKYAQQREAFGKPIAQHQAIQIKLAEMATKIQAARLMTYDAAAKKDAGQERVDLEVGMAKLFASEVCGEVAMEAMRIHGGYGYIKDFNVERYYRDAPLMIIGEGTNEIQQLLIARRLLERNAI
ncbi:MAG: acyl-CoA dehydrogenase family protein [Dehalococcoidia bacterium]|nr:acyl-CoA dehydrogenase family protein [Dehalococcoidia bacterium]